MTHPTPAPESEACKHEYQRHEFYIYWEYCRICGHQHQINRSLWAQALASYDEWQQTLKKRRNAWMEVERLESELAALRERCRRAEEEVKRIKGPQGYHDVKGFYPPNEKCEFCGQDRYAFVHQSKFQACCSQQANKHFAGQSEERPIEKRDGKPEA